MPSRSARRSAPIACSSAARRGLEQRRHEHVERADRHPEPAQQRALLLGHVRQPGLLARRSRRCRRRASAAARAPRCPPRDRARPPRARAAARAARARRRASSSSASASRALCAGSSSAELLAPAPAAGAPATCRARAAPRSCPRAAPRPARSPARRARRATSACALSASSCGRCFSAAASISLRSSALASASTTKRKPSRCPIGWSSTVTRPASSSATAQQTRHPSPSSASIPQSAG